jgi:hypothetical protein
MPRKDDPQQVKDALQAKDIELLQKNITELTGVVKEGFSGVHTRQDTTNGRITTNEKELLSLKEKFRYNRIVWYLFTVAVGAIVALVTYLLTNH